jgi:peptide/nickel transport system substrate-binding protein
MEPANIDPAATNTVGGLAIDANVMDTLLTYNLTTNTIIPDLATAWNVSSNGLMYTFTLRQGVYFVDPATNKTLDEFNATDVQYSWTRVLHIMNGYVFQGAGLNMSTFKMINTYEFSVNLTAPYSAFLSCVADFYNSIIDPNVDMAHGGYNATSGTINSFMASNLVGTGPYMMTQWVMGDHITLMRNPYYWGPRPYLNEIIINYREDPSTRFLDMKSKSVQVAEVDPDLLSGLSGVSGVVVKTIGLSLDVGTIGLDTQLFPTNNVNVRLAIEHAINYSFIDNSIFDGYAASFAGPIPMGMFGYNNSIAPYQTNITLANQEMTAAGFHVDSSGNLAFANGTELPVSTFVYPMDFGPAALLASAIQSDLAAIGFQVQIIGATSASYGSYVGNGVTGFNSSSHPQMLAQYWTPDFNDPADYTASPFPYSYTNGYVNATITNLYNEAIATSNQTLRAQLYSQLTEDTMQAAISVWAFQSVGYSVYTSNVQGLQFNPLLNTYGFEWSSVWLS